MSDVDETIDPGMDQFWSAVAETAKGSGKGYIGEVEFGFAWKVFVKKTEGEFTNSQTTFPYNTTSDKAENTRLAKEAKALANRFVVENMLKKDPMNIFYVRLHKDSVLNKDVSNWKDDRWQTAFPNSPDYIQVILPHLQEAMKLIEPKRFGKFWGRVSWETSPDQSRARDLQKKDENGAVVMDEDGNPIVEKETVLTMYVAEIYGSKAEAMAAAGVADGDAPVSATPVEVTMPEGYDAETWAMTIEEIRKEHSNGTLPAKIATAYGLSVPTIEAIVSKK